MSIPNSLSVRVASCRPKDSYAWLFAGKVRLAARKWAGMARGEETSIFIRPEDVLLSDGYPGRISARNVLPGHVRSIERSPQGVRVTLDVGIPLVSLVTEETERELQLAPGKAVYGIVKATAIAPLVSFKATFRVSLVGAKGLLDPFAIDFLRVLASAGSLSAAAKDLGIPFRMAWMRARAINQSWDRPLVVRANAGRSGGGSGLTPEGMAAVAFADELENKRLL
jgi:molybdate transport repressor ModE-like protein/molybdopterin-binding protein